MIDTVGRDPWHATFEAERKLGLARLEHRKNAANLARKIDASLRRKDKEEVTADLRR